LFWVLAIFLLCFFCLNPATAINNEVIKMSPESRCVVCDEAITNPICQECIGKEIQYWVFDRDPSLTWLFENKGNFRTESYEEGTICIFCGRKMNMCAHCFCSDILELIKDKNTEIGKEFEEHFNFELRN